MAETDAPTGVGGGSGGFGVGAAVVRREDGRMLRGAGRYVDDMRMDGQAVAVFLRSPHAHAILTGVDASRARRAPGVLAAFTHVDASALGLSPARPSMSPKAPDGPEPADLPTPHLAVDRVRYVGEPIAMVVAESLDAGRDALELIDVGFVELPAVVDPEAAIGRDAPQLYDAAPENTAYRWRIGDADAVAAGFEAAAAAGGSIASVRVENPRLAPVAIEPRAVNAAYDAEAGRWTIWTVSQGAHLMRTRLAAELGVEPDTLRVVTPDVGGGFGMKLATHVEYALVALAARRVGRPVRWTADRSESFISDQQGRGVTIRLDGAFDAEGRMHALRGRSVSDLGASPFQNGPGVHSLFSGNLLGTFYRTPAAEIEVIGALTNATPMTAYRGAGRPEVNLAMERLMDVAAEKLGVDPLEIRRRNLLTPVDAPYARTLGGEISSADGVRILERAAGLADLESVAARRAAASARGRTLGLGVAYYSERSGGAPYESARIRVRGDGRISAWVGTQSTGQGHETVWTQIVHDRLGVDPELIETPPGDTDLSPVGGGTGGSRSLIQGHRALFRASDAVIEQGGALAAELLEAAVVDIAFETDGGLRFGRPAGGRFRVAGTDRSVSLFEVAAKADGGELVGEGLLDDRVSTFPNGAHAAEIELDPETGAIRLTRYAGVDDFGRIVNPMLVDGQVVGGVVQGLGQALMERTAFDPETGQPLTGSFMDYAVPRADDLPMMRMICDEGVIEPSNPLGVKGCGEAGVAGGLSAIVLAARDALAEHGVRGLEPPFTPVRVWEAIRAARKR